MRHVGSLLKYGFLDVQLNPDFSNICEVIPRAQEIARLGREQTVNGAPWRFLTRSLDVPDRSVGWHIGEEYSKGTYGKILHANRMVVQRRPDGVYNVIEPSHHVIVKQTYPPAGATVLPAEDVVAYTSEALLHILAWGVLQDTATPWGVPYPYEVFGERAETPTPGWKTMTFCMSYVNGKTLEKYLQKHWRRSQKRENAIILLDILAQIAYILWHLQQKIQLNHRDLKIDNIMIYRRKSPVRLELGGRTFESRYEVTLIDFGFACVGCPPPRIPTTAFQTGCWFDLSELCCKKGRDIAQLLYSINCCFPLELYLPHAIAEEIRGWLQFPWARGIADSLHGFTREGEPAKDDKQPKYDTGIYQFLRRPEVDPIVCAPERVFREIVRLNGVLAQTP